MNLKVSAPARPTRILVAGDRAISRDLLTMVLRGLRYDVRTAAAGAEALTQLEAEPYALVLVDATLPDMDGCELVRRIRRRAVDGGPPVVVIGDNGDPCGRARCLEAGAQDHLIRDETPAPLKADPTFMPEIWTVPSLLRPPLAVKKDMFGFPPTLLAPVVWMAGTAAR